MRSQKQIVIISALRGFGNIFVDLPAGTDEVVALPKLVNPITKGNVDQMVLNTAPTDHALCTLSTPGFLAELIDRVL